MKSPSVEPVLRSRLLPKVSFRLVFVLTAVVAILFSLARIAGGGASFAVALMIALAFPAACFLMFSVLFLISWSVTNLWYKSDDETLKGSPFAEGQMPPQILPPREQGS